MTAERGLAAGSGNSTSTGDDDGATPAQLENSSLQLVGLLMGLGFLALGLIMGLYWVRKNSAAKAAHNSNTARSL